MANVQSYNIAPGVVYEAHPDHRNGTRHKSQWLIPEPDEVKSFRLSHASDWLVNQVGWGLHLANNRPAVLGTSSDRMRQLFVARFIDGSANDIWHGYPADHVRRNTDIPNQGLLKEWMDSGYLKPAKVSKIVRGKPCNL